ncbi:unnamed protein product, partial [Amoebophrya sp. A25]|eukprot:GSA25T00012428001.1
MRKSSFAHLWLLMAGAHVRGVSAVTFKVVAAPGTGGQPGAQVQEPAKKKLIFVWIAAGETEMNQAEPVKDVLREKFGAIISKKNLGPLALGPTLQTLLTTQGSYERADMRLVWGEYFEALKKLCSAETLSPEEEEKLVSSVANTIQSIREDTWKDFTRLSGRETFPKEVMLKAHDQIRSFAADDEADEPNRTTPIHVILDVVYPAAALAPLILPILPEGSTLKLWSGNHAQTLANLAWLGPPLVSSPPFAEGRAVESTQHMFSSWEEVRDLEILSVTGAHIPGDYVPFANNMLGGSKFFARVGTELENRGLVAKDSNFLPTSEEDAKSYERVIGTPFLGLGSSSKHEGEQSRTHQTLPLTLFGVPSSKEQPRRVWFLNSLEKKSPDPDQSSLSDSIMKSAEDWAERDLLRKVVYVAIGTVAKVPCSMSEDDSPCKRMIEDLLGLGPQFRIVWRVNTELRKKYSKTTTSCRSYHHDRDEEDRALEEDVNLKVWPHGDVDAVEDGVVDAHAVKESNKLATIDIAEGGFPQGLFLSSKLAMRGQLIFVSHCGASSVSEAVRNRVPLVSIPATIEQRANAAELVANRLAMDASPAARKYEVHQNYHDFPPPPNLREEFHSVEKVTSGDEKPVSSKRIVQWSAFETLRDAVKQIAEPDVFDKIRTDMEKFAEKVAQNSLSVAQLAEKIYVDALNAEQKAEQKAKNKSASLKTEGPVDKRTMLAGAAPDNYYKLIDKKHNLFDHLQSIHPLHFLHS